MINLGGVHTNSGGQIIPYHPNHFQSIELKGFELDYLKVFPDYAEYIARNADPSMTWTVVIRGRVVSIFGVRHLWPRVGEVWMLPGVGIEKDPISVVRGSRSILDRVIQENDFMRLQISVRKHNVTAYKFAKSLYFKEEALMECYGPELADYYLMSRLTYERNIRGREQPAKGNRRAEKG